MLFRPITVRGVTARNRIMLGPMSQYLSIDGTVTDWHLVHLGQFAIGGAGIVFCEETAVEARGRRTHHCAGIYTDEHVRAYRRITDFLKDMDAVPAIQLGHSGRRGAVRSPWEGRRPLGARTTRVRLAPWRPPFPPAPFPMARTGKHRLHSICRKSKRKFEHGRKRHGARPTRTSTCVEIHRAHGYLINQFLSPDRQSPHRRLRRRSRRPNALCARAGRGVRASWPSDKVLSVRLSVVDGKGGHWDMDDTVALRQGAQATRRRLSSTAHAVGWKAIPACQPFRKMCRATMSFIRITSAGKLTYGQSSSA